MSGRGAEMTPHAAKLQPLVRRVPTRGATDWLYERYFIGARQRVQVEPSGDEAFVAELVAACGDARVWQRGFTLARRVKRGAFVHGPVTLWVAERSTGVRPASARVGEAVSVSVPCVREAAMTGFVGLYARAGGTEHDEPHLKVYVNALPRGAVALFGALCSASELKTARFQAKALNHPRLYGRRDTALLYVRWSDAPRVVKWLGGFVRAHRAWFRDDVPPLTRRVGRGLAVAEAPFDTDESFGAQRCRLIAEGLTTARHERRAWNECVAERFERAGLDWDRPWLGLSSERSRPRGGGG